MIIEILAQAPAEKPLNPWGTALVFGGLAVTLLVLAWKKYRSGKDS